MLERFLLWIEDTFEHITKRRIKYPDKIWSVLVLAIGAGTVLELEEAARRMVIFGGTNLITILGLVLLASILLVVVLASVHAAVATLTGRSVG